MKASDLRIGNLVMFNGIIEKINLIDGDCGLIGSSSLPLFEINEATPVHVSVELLNKAGFVNESIIFYHPAFKRFAIKFWNAHCDHVKFILFLDNHVIDYYTELHIHTVQNMFKILSGEELTFDL